MGTKLAFNSGESRIWKFRSGSSDLEYLLLPWSITHSVAAVKCCPERDVLSLLLLLIGELLWLHNAELCKTFCCYKYR